MLFAQVFGLVQSVLVLQPSPDEHVGHVPPPQSIPVSAPDFTESVQVRQTRLSHLDEVQSVLAAHVSPATHA